MRGEVPADIRRSMELWVGCIAGALEEDAYLVEVERRRLPGSVDSNAGASISSMRRARSCPRAAWTCLAWKTRSTARSQALSSAPRNPWPGGAVRPPAVAPDEARARLQGGPRERGTGSWSEVLCSWRFAARCHDVSSRSAAVPEAALSPTSEEDRPWPGHRYVITVCDRAAETCPVFPGRPQRIHWSFPDPAVAEGSEEDRQRAFDNVARGLVDRVRSWLEALPSEDDTR